MSETENNKLEAGEKNLGIAGNTAKQFINSPVTPLLMFAFLAIGVMGLMFTPRQEDPKISVPMVDIYMQYPGAAAEQVTSLVTEPLERLMSELPGVRHVYSATQRGSSIVTVQFRVGEDLGASIVKVHDKLQSNLDKIPPGVSMPLVKPVGIDDVPIVTATLWSKPEEGGVDDATLRTLALDILQNLKSVPNTGNGFVVGGRSEQIRVEVSPERLGGFGISMAELAKTIRTANAEIETGYVESGNRSFTVYSGAFLTSADEISRLVIGVYDDAPVYVHDVATVFQYPEETKQLVSYYTGIANAQPLNANGEAAVTIAIAKKIDTNGVTVAEAILDKLESLKGRIIPDNVHVDITRNYGKTANQKVNELLIALFEAALAVSLLCLLFMGLRAASVIIIIIPIVVLVTIWSALILDYTIDRVSLFALVFSIGILVDDATVVVENIFRRWLAAGKTSTRIAIDAVREVGNPTILATLTIIAALLPMGFVSGLMGPYMRPIPVLGASAMFFSLIAAFVFAPWFAMRVRPKLKALQQAEKREQRFSDMLGKYYRPCMQPLCKNKFYGKVFLAGLVAATLFAVSMFYFNWVAVKMLPFDNKPEFNVVINMPEGSALPVTANITHELVNVLREIPEVTDLQSYVGTASPFNFNGMVRHYYLRQQPWEADIQVMLLDKNDRERGSHAIAVEARHRIKEFLATRPELTDTGVKTQVVEMPPGPPVLQTVVAEIYGPDAQTRRQVARDMTSIFTNSKDIVDVDNYIAAEYNYWRFEVDIEKSVRYGISVDMINQQLDMAMGGYKLGDIKRKVVREPTYIVMQVPLAMRSQLTRLYSMPVMSANGDSIPLGEIGRFAQASEDPIIFHKDLRAVEYVTAEMEGKLGAPIYGMHTVEEQLKFYITPDGETITGLTLGGTIGRYGPPEDNNKSGFEWGGEWTVTFETFRDMGSAFMAALVLIYALIVWEFKNYTLAGLIMAPIPLTLIGIIPGHLIIGAEFTATSMIGFIALAGIIVRNSILLVEFVKYEVAAGKDIVEAVICAGQIRMRPILITAGTLMVGAAMLFSDPIFIGMAASLFFGTLVATVLTLVVIPLGCITVRSQFYALAGVDVPETEQVTPKIINTSKQPLWLFIWGSLITALFWLLNYIRTIYSMLKQIVNNLINRSGTDDSTPTDSSGSGGNGPDVPRPASPSTSEINTEKSPTVTVEKNAEVKDKATENKQKKSKAKSGKKKVSKKKAGTIKSSAAGSKKKTSKSKKRRGIRLKKI
ncbi:Acriflavin resistance protein [hydrothermal vent metagenome]|uniref:Acriflavin resistance protein n=1 Tax=hydrothermal vent metagenome TaxID=652676 RepID=A0A3B1AMS4_9ZZZZ